MYVNLIYDKDNENPIGWKLNPSTEYDHEIIAEIRDMQFLGSFNDETRIEYGGIELFEPEKGKVIGNIESIKWIQNKYNK